MSLDAQCGTWEMTAVYGPGGRVQSVLDKPVQCANQATEVIDQRCGSCGRHTTAEVCAEHVSTADTVCLWCNSPVAPAVTA